MLGMFKTLVAAGLLSVVAALPADTSAKCVPTADTCRPFGLVQGNSSSYFIQSTGSPNLVWQAEDVTPTSFGFIDLAPKASATNSQLWAIQGFNRHDSFSFVSKGPTSNVCANGDGGPLDTNACDTVFNTIATDQDAQFFITCQTCGSTSATGCQFQSAGEGQCASFLNKQQTTVKLDDCVNTAPHQLWDIVSA
ncbi:hypothetical protein BDQ12DRAFT_737634 [Crucibulum laeve]|uniref:Ricin B lectin domain-containing protein n=1 Tax=Crucibulum laeve TaxID=68775 RepID=A0A5C3LQH8_9AGAR|nr:hypothetical protein BDQ12DRAFT_737634 [Crucibulum laeve]